VLHDHFQGFGDMQIRLGDTVVVLANGMLDFGVVSVIMADEMVVLLSSRKGTKHTEPLQHKQTNNIILVDVTNIPETVYYTRIAPLLDLLPHNKIFKEQI
jgi:hypothetical protein